MGRPLMVPPACFGADRLHGSISGDGMVASRSGLEGRCRLVPLLGNHEQMLLEARSGLHPTTWLGMGGLATLASYGPGHDLSLIPQAHFEFLEGCLDYNETDTHIFVHAGYDPDLPMGQQPADLLRWGALRDGIPGPHRSGKAVIVGHTSQKGGEVLDLGHVTCIDTFCYGGGWLSALDVRTGEVWQADRGGSMREV
jgi:serine/threonine protein phosphatase 1